MGYVLVLATATTETQIDIYTNKNKKMSSKLNLKDYFDLIIKKEDVSHKKPHPEIYLKVLEYYNTTPDRCLVFEDSLHGVLSSTAAGIETISVYDKYSDKDRERINELSDYTIESFSEFLEKLNAGQYTRKIEPRKIEDSFD